MKVAVIGAGPLGLEAALCFSRIGAEVTLFGGSELSKKSFNLFANTFEDQFLEGTWAEISSEHGRELVALQASGDECPTLKQYYQDYFLPLWQKRSGFSRVKAHEVLRVHKRLLFKGERPEGKSRMIDLFRVTYQGKSSVDFKEELRKIGEGLSEKDVENLKEDFETFEDFDLVFDCSGAKSHFGFSGAGGVLALNEKSASESGSILYAHELLEKQSLLNEAKKVTVIGQGLLASRVLLLLKNELHAKEVTLITPETSIFERLESEFKGNFIEQLNAFLKEEETLWKEQCFETEKRLQEWRGLEAFERAKLTKPEFPEPRLKIFGGYTVTSIDTLSDREGLFCTFEKESWRRDSGSDVMTSHTELIVSCNEAFRRSGLYDGLEQDEPGFYIVGAQKDGFYSMKTGIETINFALKDILKFFSRDDT